MDNADWIRIARPFTTNGNTTESAVMDCREPAVKRVLVHYAGLENLDGGISVEYRRPAEDLIEAERRLDRFGIR